MRRSSASSFIRDRFAIKSTTTIPVICTTSNKLNGSVWVRPLENKNWYINLTEANAPKMKIHINVWDMYFLRVNLPSLKSTSALKRAAKISGTFSKTSKRYLLTKELHKSPCNQGFYNIKCVPVVLTMGFAGRVVGIDGFDRKFIYLETELFGAPEHLRTKLVATCFPPELAERIFWEYAKTWLRVGDVDSK